MTRRKKSKSAANSADAGGATAPAQSKMGVSQPNEALAQTINATSGPCLLSSPFLAPRPVLPISGPRPVYPIQGSCQALSSSGPRPLYLLCGPRPYYASPQPAPVRPIQRPRQGYIYSEPRRDNSLQSPRKVIEMSESRSFHPSSRTLPNNDTSRSGSINVSPVPNTANTPLGPRLDIHSSSPGLLNVTSSPNGAKASSTTSIGPSELANSVISNASTSISDFKDNEPKNSKPRQAMKTIVSYETKQINIHPRHPILTVERLKDLEYHVGVLTISLGRRPKVYQHGRGVRFVPETNDEYKAIQRYLAKIESQERIAWCSYSLPPGNSLKVNIKVRVVERVKIADNLMKLKLQDSSKSSEAERKDTAYSGVKHTTNPQEKGITAAVSPPSDKRVSAPEPGRKYDSDKHRNTNVNSRLYTSGAGQLDLKPKEKREAPSKKRVVATGSHQESGKKVLNTNVKNQRTIKPIYKDGKPKESSEKEISSPGLKTGQNVYDNKLRIVGVNMPKNNSM